jgi:hypothetical protein
MGQRNSDARKGHLRMRKISLAYNAGFSTADIAHELGTSKEDVQRALWGYVIDRRSNGITNAVTTFYTEPGDRGQVRVFLDDMRRKHVPGAKPEHVYDGTIRGLAGLDVTREETVPTPTIETTSAEPKVAERHDDEDTRLHLLFAVYELTKKLDAFLEREKKEAE